MNTLRDTDERQARPSVWPVYVMAAVVGLQSLGAVGYPMVASEVVRLMSPPDVYETLHPYMQRWVNWHGWLLPYVGLVVVWGVFGIMVAVGAARLRAWAWWSMVVWTILFVGWWGSRCVFLRAGVAYPGVGIAWIALVAWVLATRRRLFFPAKSETMTGKKRPRYQVVLFVVVPLVLVAGLAIFLVWHGEGVRDTARQVRRGDPEQARKELQAELDKIKVAGEPMTLEEIIPPEVPDEENAALLYQRAFEELSWSEGDVNILGNLGRSIAEPPRSEAPSMATIERIVANNTTALALLENAAKRPECRFPVDWSAGMAAQTPHLAELRLCALLLAAQTALQMERGEASEALHTIETGLSMCEAIRDEPNLISQLARYAITSILLRPLRVALDEKVSTRACRGLFDYLAGMEFMQSLVRTLWAERVVGDGVFDVLRQDPERAMEEWPRPGGGSGSGIYAAPLGHTILNVDEVMYLRLMARKIAAAEKSSWDSREELAEIDRRVEALSFPHIVTASLLPIYARSTATRDRAIARVGLAQVALVLKAYKNEKGEYPESLAQLPEVIEWADLPEDPFSGQDFIYRREGEGFLIYSIGADLEDDGGKAEEDWEEGDIVWRCAK